LKTQIAKKNLNNIKMRASNFALVINAVREYGQISRTDLAPIVGLTSATITNLVSLGLEDGYLTEVGCGNSQGGRRPKLIELNSEAGYIIGIEINAKEVICVLTDFKENIIAKHYCSIDPSVEAEALIDQIANTVNAMLDDNDLTNEDVFGAGFATIGPCDHINGVIVHTPNFPKWRNVRVADLFEEKTGIKVYLEKETAAFALNEAWQDKTKRYKRIFCVNVFALGIGGGMALDRSIFHGHKSGGLEVGHMTVQPDGPVCVCGKSGCLERMADGRAAIDYYKEFVNQGVPTQVKTPEAVNLSDIIAGAQAEDEACVASIKKCAKYLGNAISSLISILAPDVIYIGGEFIDQSRLLFDETVIEASKRTYPFIDADIEIKRSTSGKDSGALGAVAMVLKNIFLAE
jgi:predicted NBD/HSP70 family sugar kinase